MKKNLYAGLMLCMIGSLLAGCSKDDGDEGNNSGGGVFDVKQGTVAYEAPFFEQSGTVYFANYGKQIRIAYDYDDPDFDDDMYIVDEIAGKAWYLNEPQKRYREISLAEGIAERKNYVIPAEKEIMAEGDYAKTTETIAGKPCTVYRDESTGSAAGHWNKLIFLYGFSTDAFKKAVSFSESAPQESMFSPPADFAEE